MFCFVFTFTLNYELIRVVSAAAPSRVLFTVPDASCILDTCAADATVPQGDGRLSLRHSHKVAALQVTAEPGALIRRPVVLGHGVSSPLGVEEHGTAAGLVEF